MRSANGCLITLAYLAFLGRSSAQEMNTPPPAEAALLPPVELSSESVQPAGFDFSKVPPVPRPPVRFGMFAVPPAGPGYYSALDWLTGTYREAPPKDNFPRFGLSGMSFFDYDWRFLDDPSYDPDLLDGLKRVRVGDNWLASTGGEVRYRYQDEYHSRLTTSDNLYSLTRVRAYADVWYQDLVRFYIEGIYADSHLRRQFGAVHCAPRHRHRPRRFPEPFPRSQAR
jgi:hypothetical protein